MIIRLTNSGNPDILYVVGDRVETTENVADDRVLVTVGHVGTVVRCDFDNTGPFYDILFDGNSDEEFGVTLQRVRPHVIVPHKKDASC